MKKINQVIAYTQKKLAQEKTGHDFEHAKRTAFLAKQIIKEDELQVNSFIVMASAYLHDIIDDKVTANPQKACEELQVFLKKIGCSFEETGDILTNIQNLSFSSEIFTQEKPFSLEGKIVQDADRLEALGAGGILRAAYFSGAHGQAIYDKSHPRSRFYDKKEYRQPTTMINHIYEKLFLLPELMNTDYGKKEGIRRKKFMQEFLQEFYKEWYI